MALAAARRNKARTHPELLGGDGRARLVVLAAEVGGRWSEEARKFLGALTTAKARSAPVLLQPAAWLHRWHAQQLVVLLSPCLGNTADWVDGDVPSMMDVLCDFRHLL